ncbi:hypothetical protein AB1N83_011134 [Pleurotus pulmonarius]
MASLITRLRQRGNSREEDQSPPPTPPENPTPLLAQKIHPNLDVLAAELTPATSNIAQSNPPAHITSNPHVYAHGLTPSRHPSQRTILVTTAERESSSESPPPPSTHAQRRKSPRIRVFQRASQLSPGSPPASLPSTPDQDVYRPGSKKRFVRGLGLAEFGGTEAQVSPSASPSRVGSSEAESPTTSMPGGYSRQRDSRSTGTSSSPGNSRPGSGYKRAARPQSAFMTRFASTDAASHPPSPSDVPTHSRSISETTSHYESAVASLRSSVQNVEVISPPRTPGPSRARHAETPNTFGFASPATSHSASTSSRPPLPPFQGLNLDFAIPRTRRRSHSVGSGSGSRWSLRTKRSKSSSGKESVDDVREGSSSTIFPHDANKRRGRSWSRSRNKAPQSRRGQSSKRRVSADLNARQAAGAPGVSWQADIAHEVVRYLEFGSGSERLEPSLSVTRDEDRPGPEDASSSSFPIGDNLSYTQSRAHIYHQRPIDNTGISATTLHSPSRRTDKGNAASPRAAQSQSSSSKGGGSVGRKSSPPKSALRPQVATSTSLLQPPTLELTLPTPDGSPGRRSASEPSVPPLQSALKVPGQLSRSNTSGSKGKRKADDVEVTPPKDREAGRAKFATEPRSHRASANSGSSYAPSSYHRKRARLSISENDREGNFSTISSRSSSVNPQTPAQTPSRAASRTSARATSSRSVPRSHPSQPHRHGPRRSMSEISQTSIPISALISPHAPSISQYSTTFHMRDPKRPPKPFETPWSLRLATPGEPGSGSPIHAWMFFFGFIIFPLWWVASFWRIPRTRKMGGTDVEKAVVLDDPQVEFDAKSWRFRCRIMTGISFITYIPFIVLVAIFAR